MEDETRDIQQDVLDNDDLEMWHEMPHPQDDLPTEVVISYIVADYRRMYHALDHYKALAKLTEKQIEARAREIAARRKAETNELADLRLELAEKNSKMREMYDWLSHKENMISALRKYIEDHRQEVSSLQRSVTSQRYQIQSLLGHFDDKYKVLEDCPEAWNSEAWRESVIRTVTLAKQLVELMNIVDGMNLGDSQHTILKSAIDIIRKQVRRTHSIVRKIAIPALRKEFSADFSDIDDNENDNQ